MFLSALEIYFCDLPCNKMNPSPGIFWLTLELWHMVPSCLISLDAISSYVVQKYFWNIYITGTVLGTEEIRQRALWSGG